MPSKIGQGTTASLVLIPRSWRIFFWSYGLIVAIPATTHQVLCSQSWLQHLLPLNIVRGMCLMVWGGCMQGQSIVTPNTLGEVEDSSINTARQVIKASSQPGLQRNAEAMYLVTDPLPQHAIEPLWCSCFRCKMQQVQGVPPDLNPGKSSTLSSLTASFTGGSLVMLPRPGTPAFVTMPSSAWAAAWISDIFFACRGIIKPACQPPALPAQNMLAHPQHALSVFLWHAFCLHIAKKPMHAPVLQLLHHDAIHRCYKVYWSQDCQLWLQWRIVAVSYTFSSWRRGIHFVVRSSETALIMKRTRGDKVLLRDQRPSTAKYSSKRPFIGLLSSFFPAMFNSSHMPCMHNDLLYIPQLLTPRLQRVCLGVGLQISSWLWHNLAHA